MKKSLILLLVFSLAFIGGCKKMDMIIPVEGDDSIPDPVNVIPGEAGDPVGPFRFTGTGSTLNLFFCNSADFVADTIGVPFWQYQIGAGPWSGSIVQGAVVDAPDWGSGVLPTGLLPDETIIRIRYGGGSTYANLFSSSFYNPTLNCLEFQLGEINN